MPTKPQDHKTKTAQPDEPFEFAHAGKTYQLAPPSEVLTAGFARANRRRSQEDQLFTMLEALADDDTLKAIDEMKRDEFKQFQIDFYSHIGVELGE
nr:hypothetical protein [Microbacterium bovistercoris]